MRRLFEIFKVLQFQKRIVTPATIWGNTLYRITHWISTCFWLWTNDYLFEITLFLCAKNLIRNDFKNNLHVVRHFLIDQIKLKLKQRQQKLLIPVPILFPFIDIHWTERYLIKKLSSVSINITYWGRNYQNIFCVIFFIHRYRGSLPNATFGSGKNSH